MPKWNGEIYNFTPWKMDCYEKIVLYYIDIQFFID